MMSDFACTLCGGSMRPGHARGIVSGDIVYCDRGHLMSIDLEFDPETGDTRTTAPFPAREVWQYIRLVLERGCPSDFDKPTLLTIAAAARALSEREGHDE